MSGPRVSLLFGAWALCAGLVTAQDEATYAERLGWPQGTRALILHADDVGMSLESNEGTREGFADGLVTSCSVMMPCSWVPDWLGVMQENPDWDCGLHLTLTSEWRGYRWGPVAGRDAVPGLVDDTGYMWRAVLGTIMRASADEVETEIRAQIALARRMGMPITHLDSHMGTLFYSPAYFDRYLKVGIEMGIPVMIMSGKHNRTDAPDLLVQQVRRGAQRAWDGGLPVLDDLFTETADTGDPEEMIDALIDRLRHLEPGVTQIILHPTRPDANWNRISGSGRKREAELEMVLSPEVKKVIEEEGIVLTTWRELKERRDAVGDLLEE